MTTTETIRTDTWTLSLPKGWIEKGQTAEGAHYFESADESKGIYISTWQVEEKDPRNARNVAEAFKAADLRSLQGMEGYAWRTVADNTETFPDSTVTVTDWLDEAKLYRMVGKVIARPPMVIRANFHDYECVNYDVSKAYFAPIIEALRLYDAA